MSTKIRLVEIPRDLLPHIGEPVGDSHVFRKDGPEEGLGEWYDKLTEHFEGLISPGGASMYAPVSRAAVHKRLKEGNLTGFFYYPTTIRKSFFGKARPHRSRPYGFILVQEIKQWAVEIMEQAQRLGYITVEEIEGASPDHNGEFIINWNSKWAATKAKKKGRV